MRRRPLTSAWMRYLPYDRERLFALPTRFSPNREITSPPNTYEAPGCQQALTSLDACLPGQRSFRARRSSFSSDFVSNFGFQTLRVCTKHLSGLLGRSIFVSVSQKLVRALARPCKSTWIWVPLSLGSRKGQSSPGERPSALRDRRRRGGGSPIKTSGYRARSRTPLGVLGTGSALASSAMKPAPVRRLDHPPPLLYFVSARNRSISKTRSLVRIK